MQTNIYPNIKAQNWRVRLAVAWRVLWHGEWFPAPLEWYAKLYPIVTNEYAHFAEMAVQKAEREFAHTSATRAQRHKEAVEWMRHYAVERGKSPDIAPWLANFLIEWWVGRSKGWI